VNPLDFPFQHGSRLVAHEPQPLFKPLLRTGLGVARKSADPVGSISTSIVHSCDGGIAEVRTFVAKSAADLEHADRLVAERYAWRGYRLPSIDPCMRDPDGLTGPYLTLLSEVSGNPAGTVTLGFDSPRGLFADDLYADCINTLREQGRRVCELVRFAVNRGDDCRLVLDSLFNLSYRLARVLYEWTDLVIEVNPRHALFYRRLLGFVQLGDEEVCPRVGAPSVLLSLSEQRLRNILGFPTGPGVQAGA